MRALFLAFLGLAGGVQAGESAAPLSSFNLADMDRTADPCRDFYQYACGGWIKTHPIPADQSRWGRFDELEQRNLQVLREILEQAERPVARRDDIARRAGDLYAACMDEGEAEKKGVQPLSDVFDAIEGLHSASELPPLLARLHALGVNVGFAFDSEQDHKDSTKVIGAFDQAGLGLPDRDYYLKEDEKSVQLRRQYEEHVARTLQLAGSSEAQSKAQAAAVMRLETALARASLDRVARRDPDKVYHRMSAAELARSAPGFDWDLYLKDSGAPRSPWLNVTVPSFMEEFSALASTATLADWKDYLRWHAVSGASPVLSRAFVDEDFDFYGRKLRGVKELKPRWKRCVELVDGELGHDLGRLYVAKAFGADAKRRMDALVAALQAALRRDIESVGWMTPSTRRYALEKLSAVGDKIGYPSKWRDYMGVNIDRKDLLGSIQSADRYETQRRLAKIGKPVDRTEWHMTPPTVNAYYSPRLNEIVFPAGILQPPFFDRSGDDAANLGAIGVIIGHELTHGFDDQGRKFDAHGNRADWWTPEDAKAFETRASCLADQYGNYETLPGLKLNGRLTLGENTADNGGLRLADMAMEELERSGGKLEARDGFTPRQRLFLGFAQAWCANVTEEEARMLARIDPHSPPRWRVIGAVGNQPEFSQAFSCQTGAPMIPAKTCRVW